LLPEVAVTFVGTSGGSTGAACASAEGLLSPPAFTAVTT
jgi:hypothetical protein